MSGDQDVFADGATAVAPLPSDGENQADDAGQEHGVAEAAGFSEEELAGLLDQRVTTRLEQRINALYQGMQGLSDRQQAATQRRIDALEEKLSFVNQWVEENWDEEKVAEFKRKQREAQLDARQRELDARQQAAQDAALRAAQQQQNDPVQAEAADLQRWFNEDARDELDEYASDAGVDMTHPSIQRRWPKEMPLRADGKLDKRGFIKQIKTLIDDAADEAKRTERVTRQRASVDTTRPSGGGLGHEATWQAYGRGEIPWSAQVQAAGKALGAL